MKLTSIDGLGPVTEKKLNGVGIIDSVQFLSHSPAEISEITGVDSETSAKWWNNAYVAMVKENADEKVMSTATEIDNKRKNAKKIDIGCKPFNDLLGGLETGALYEIYGEFGANKSQFGFNMAVRIQLPEDQGGLGEDTKVAYLDTEHTFRPERIRTMAERWGMDVDKVMNNIMVWRIRNTVQQQMALEEIEKRIIEGEKIKLIVVDSGTGLFRSEYLGRGTLSNRQARINKFISLLSHFCDVHDLCGIFTNQVLADPGQSFGDPTKAVGGNVVAHTSTYRIYFKKAGKNRIARIIDSPHHPDGEISFRVMAGGFYDVDEAEALDKENKKEITKSKRAATRAKNKEEEYEEEEKT